MNALSNLVTLPHFVELTVPSTVAIDIVANVNLIKNVLDKVSSVFAKAFGGATVTNGDGEWYSDSLQSVVSEPVKIVKSYAVYFDDESIQLIVDTAKFVKDELSQESVLISIDGIAYLV